MGCLGFFSVAVTGLALLVAPGVWAQTTDDSSRAAARELGTSGVEAFQRGDFESAVAKLEKAYRVLCVPSIGLWSARALEKSGKLLKASERYREVGLLEISSGQATVQRQAQTDAATELAALTPRLAGVIVQVEGAQQADLMVLVDGMSMASELLGERRPLDPGKHVIEATQGGKHASAEVQLKEGEAKTVVLRFTGPPVSAVATPAESAPSPALAAQPNQDSAAASSKTLGTQRLLALAVGGVGIAGVAVGTVFGLKAKSKHDDSDHYCNGNACTDQRGVDLNNEAKSAGTISTIGFLIGGVGLAGGTALWVTGRPRDPKKTELSLGWGAVLVRGTW
jgi:hypothetical protein